MPIKYFEQSYGLGNIFTKYEYLNSSIFTEPHPRSMNIHVSLFRFRLSILCVLGSGFHPW